MSEVDNFLRSIGELEEQPDTLYFDPIDHRYTYNNVTVPSVTTIISNAPEHYDFKYSQSIPAFVLKRAADKGTAIHLAIEARYNDIEVNDYFKGLARKHQGYLDAFTAFTHDYNYVPIWHERRFVNLDLVFAGTVDCFAYVNGVKTIVDYKTQRKPTPIKWMLQLAAYSTFIEADQALIIWLSEKGYETFFFTKGDLIKALKTFINLCDWYHTTTDTLIDYNEACRIVALFSQNSVPEPSVLYSQEDLNCIIAGDFE